MASDRGRTRARLGWIGAAGLAATTLAPPPSAASPDAAAYYVGFRCLTDGGFEILGTDPTVPELLPLDHTGSCVPHTCTFTGVAETLGPGFPLPLARVELNGQSNLVDLGTDSTGCGGVASILYTVELIHASGDEARSVPLRIRSRGAVSATASINPNPGGSWSAKAVAGIEQRVAVGGGAPVSTWVEACQGGLSILGLCEDPKPAASLDADTAVPVDVPAGVLASERVEVTIAAQATVDVEGVKYPPEWGSLDSAGQGSAIAWIDPRIWIDPTWEYAGEYRLEVSPGIPLPEPMTGVPLAVGLGGLLAGMLRRRS